MKVTNYYPKVSLVHDWERKNKIIITAISIIAVLVSIFILTKLRVVSDIRHYVVGSIKPVHFYFILFILSLTAIGKNVILKDRVDYLNTLSINNKDYDKFVKALKITYLDKIVIFFIYVIVYTIIGFAGMYLNLVVERSVI
jgi:hypothetical protein